MRKDKKPKEEEWKERMKRLLRQAKILIEEE